MSRFNSESTPEEQVAAYLRGSQEAFLEIDLWMRVQLRAQYPALLDEEEDLCQVVHGKLLVNLREGRFRGQSTLRSYVCGIVHYTAVDRLRERYRDREVRDEGVAPATAGDNPYQAMERADELRLFHRVVTALPSACRELWRMVFVEKLSYAEIGEALAIPTGTVKSRMWHCRRKASSILKRLRLGRRRDH